MANDIPLLPKFKEKVMYIPKEDSKTKIESSYVISSSFKGIVRLSPNNHTTVSEKIIAQLSNADENALGTTYSDAIVFEDDALESIKSDADITRRMIIGSDSDGYLVNFRIGIDDIEFDNLGVIGIQKANELVMMSSKSSFKDEILTLNRTQMPSFAQQVKSCSSTAIPQNLYYYDEKQNTYARDNNDRLDVKKVKVIEQGDDSYLLYGTRTGGKRVFKYKQTQKFIKELIMQALMDLETIPTGSIHWVPVSVEQYKALIETGQRPNICTYQGFTSSDSQESSSQSVTMKSDPIVRDFLLCDGREYYSADFPELAKTLWGEDIVVWKREKTGLYTSEGVDEEPTAIMGAYPYVDSKCNAFQSKKDENDPNSTDDFKTFRVPDLRHMFISSCYINGTTSLTTNPNTSDGFGENYNKYNRAGVYTVDNLPTNRKKYFNNDDHVHFIAYGTNGVCNRSDVTQKFTIDRQIGMQPVAQGWYYKKGSEQGQTINDVTQHDAIKLKLTDSPRMMYLQNHPLYRNQSFGSGTTAANGANGFGYGKFPPVRGGIQWRNLRTNFSVPAIMYLSMPGGSTNSTRKSLVESNLFDNTSMIGLSSVQIPSLEEVGANDVYGADENDVYKNEQYVTFNADRYGHESTPKFYAMLPLIKI